MPGYLGRYVICILIIIYFDWKKRTQELFKMSRLFLLIKIFWTLLQTVRNEKCLSFETVVRCYLQKRRHHYIYRVYVERVSKIGFMDRKYKYNGSIFEINNVFICIASVSRGWMMGIMNWKQIKFSNCTTHICLSS
jgi:hypothetical protein